MDESAKCLTVLLILMDPEFYPFDLDIKNQKKVKNCAMFVIYFSSGTPKDSSQ